MSVRSISRVWDGSQHSGTELLMLLAIADFADDDGRAYPSVASLARKCRMQPRNARYILNELQVSGELKVQVNAGPRGANLYRLIFDAMPGLDVCRPLQPAAGVQDVAGMHHTAGVQGSAGLQPTSATPATHCRKPLQRIAAEPSLNRQEPGVGRAKRSAAASDRGTRLPSDWALPADLRAYCEQKRPDLDPDAVAENFRDFWVAKPGMDARKLDWPATFRRWVREQRVTDRRFQSHGGRDPMAAVDQFAGGV